MSLQPGVQLIRHHMAREVRSFSRAELETTASRQSLRTAIKQGVVVRIFEGIYLAAEHQDSFAARAHAALRWAGPRAALGGEAALFLWRIVEDPPKMIQVIVPHSNGIAAPPWVKLTRITYRVPTAEWQGLAIVTAEIALTQAYGYLDRQVRDSTVFRAVAMRLIYLPDLVDALRSIPRMRARYSLRQAAEAAARGTESFLEHQGATSVFNCRELSGLIQQHWLRVGPRSFRCDFYDAATRTAVELDGAAFHGNDQARKRDIRRDAELASIGVLTVRYGYSDVMNRPQWCRSTLINVLNQRRSTTR